MKIMIEYWVLKVRDALLEADAFSNRRLKEMTFVELRMNIKFCGYETDKMLKHMYSNDTLLQMQDFELHPRFREGRESLEDAERSGCRRISHTAENFEKISAAAH
ncbi:hypothetical protein TNCV_4935761 [Trichonephila clavipes]|nr:hypothetical protein TNCV_4935761 [Trichonephila clavipes]